MATLVAPIAFRKFGLNLDPLLLDEGEEDVIDFALGALDNTEMRAVRDFLIKVLTTPLSAEKLQEAWGLGHSNVFIRKENELRAFIREIIRKIDLSIGPEAAP
jgi:hypothetical protein